MYYTIDNSIIIEALLRLSKIERIIIILNVLNDITLLAIAFLLDTNMNSLYVQKNSALKKFRKEFSHYFHYGILKYEEVKQMTQKSTQIIDKNENLVYTIKEVVKLIRIMSTP